MAVKYRIEYTSVNGIEYRCDLISNSYSGTITAITGSVEYGMNDVDSLSYPIRSKFLKLSLLATIDIPLVDIFTSNEREWKVELYSSGLKIFFGYLTIENAPQSFVADSWYVDVDVLGPLGFLEDLAYVDLSGNKYNGYEQVAKVIANCLKRGFLDQSDAFNILSYEHFDYRTQSPSDNSFTEYTSGRILKDTVTDQDIYIDDDSGESLSCLEVLKNILKSLQLTITQINGDTWLLGHFLYDQSTVPSGYINSYDKDGDDITDLPISPFSTIQIKTDSEANLPTDIIHVNENQGYYYVRGLQKLVLDHKYQYKKSQLENPDFSGGTNGGAMPNWSLSNDYAESSDQGFVKILRYDSGVNTDKFAMRSTSEVYVIRDQTLKIKGKAFANYDNAILKVNAKYSIPTQADPKYIDFIGDALNPVVGWSSMTDSQAEGRSIFIENGNETSFEFELPKTLEFGTLELYVYASEPSVSGNTSEFVELRELDLAPNDANITGRSRITESSDSSLKSDKDEIFLNTSRGSVLGNHLYKSDNGNPPIVGVLDKSRTNNYSPLDGNYALSKIYSSKKRKIFYGDFYHFIEPHNYIQIPDLGNEEYVILEYLFDTVSNTGSLKVEERNSDNVTLTLSEENNIYSETIEPKIET